MSDEFVTVDFTGATVDLQNERGIKIDGKWYPYSGIEFIKCKNSGILEPKEFSEAFERHGDKIEINYVSMEKWIADDRELSYDE